MDIKLVLTDIDGVWTDGGMYYDRTGNEWKKFNAADGAGIVLLHEAGIKTGIITGENIEIVRRRAEKLKIEILNMGAKNKRQALREISQAENISFENIAYIGDDVLDIPVFELVGFSAVPANAPEYVARHAQYSLNKQGGEGAFREFAEMILMKMGLFDQALDQWLKRLKAL